MILRVILSLVLCASFTLGAMPVVQGKVTPMPASYDSYDLTYVDGGTLSLKLLGGSIFFETGKAEDCDRPLKITLSRSKNKRVVKSFNASGKKFSLDVSKHMDEGELYCVTIHYEAYGTTVNCGDNLIFRQGSNIYFWKSDNYDYNVVTCQELWTDEQSLKECLEPQNDIECDDPVLIGYSNRIVEGAKDDWEKVFRIYKFISSEMAYDKREAETTSAGYQDSAVDVIRSGRSICEGFANCFVALCRAQGIPAVVEFGIGFTSYEEITNRKPTSQDYADHAWAAVFLGGKWHFVDPTFDMSRYYYGPNDIRTYEETTKYYLLPLEAISNDHMIMDADTRHGIPTAGYCGTDRSGAKFEITRDGVCHITGSGALKMPYGVNGFSKVVFEEGSNITELLSDCFRDCDLLTTIVLPDSVTTIDEYAFATCEDLQYVYLPEGLVVIGKKAFRGCDELSYVRVPDKCKVVGEKAFDGCPRLYLSISEEHKDMLSGYDTPPMFIDYR